MHQRSCLSSTLGRINTDFRPLLKWRLIVIFQFACYRAAFQLLYVKRTTVHDTTKSRPLYVHVHTKKFQFFKIFLNATCDLAWSPAATHSLRYLGPPTVSEYVEHSHARRPRTNSHFVPILFAVGNFRKQTLEEVLLRDRPRLLVRL